MSEAMGCGIEFDNMYTFDVGGHAGASHSLDTD